MSDAPRFNEIDGQHVELLPARTVLGVLGVLGAGSSTGGQGGTGDQADIHQSGSDHISSKHVVDRLTHRH